MKTRILMLVYEPHHSGQGRHILSLAGGLDKSKYEVRVMCPAGNKETIEGLEKLGIMAIPTPMHKLRNSKAACRLIAVIRDSRPHILHVHSQEAGLWARAVGWLTGVKMIVYTPHTVKIRQKRWQGAYEMWERLMGLFTHRLIALNDGQRQELIRKRIISARKTVVIYNGIASTPFEILSGALNRNSLAILSSHKIITQIGRLSVQKGTRYFLEAAKMVLEERPETTFLLVGEGPLAEEMRLYAETLGISPQVRFLGWRDDVPAILAATDICVLASLWEGLPYTLLEAMAARKPVVATDTDGSREVVEEGRTGFLVPPGDVPALAEKILVLLGDGELRREMGKEGRERLEKHFLVEVMIEKVEEVYDELISKKLA